MMNAMISPLRTLIESIARERDANVTLIAALALLPTLFGLGFCIDYSRAEMLQSRINAVADAAALTATDTLYIKEDWPTAQAAAYQVFTSQVAEYKDFQYDPTSKNLNITQSTPQGALNNERIAIVDWAGYSLNMFSGILGMNSLVIGGTSTAKAIVAPFMNFYLMMDKSPSMLLPSTSVGITAVKGATSDGCAFACHQQQPGTNYIKDTNGKFVFIDQNFYQSTGGGIYYLIDGRNNLYDSSGNMLGSNVSVSGGTNLTYTSGGAPQSITGYYADGYWLTHNYTKIYPSGSAIDLRVSDETAAAKALIPYATQQAGINKVTYQLQFFSFDWTHPSASSPVTQYNSMTDVSTLSTSAVPDLDGTQDWWYSNNKPTASTSNSDQGTEFYKMLTSISSVMPTTGGSGGSATDPQDVLMIITDGVVDENTDSGRLDRELGSTELAACQTIKNRGIKIAILYTYYDPNVLKGDSWSQTNVAPYLPNVLPALQSCASPGNDGNPLVYTVQSDQSITTALQTLFQLTISNSHLVG